MKPVALLFLIFVFAGLAPETASGQAASFTYQGQLRQSGEPFTGMADLEFRLFDQLIGGTEIGSVQSRVDVPIENGLFQVELDFGAAAFDGSDRFLEVTVDGAPLIPRQQVTATPYSLGTRGFSVDDFGNVGIGLEVPASALHVNGQIRSPSFRASGGSNIVSLFNPNGETASYFLGWQNDVPRLRVGGSGSGSNGGFDIQRIGDATLLRIDGDGRLGIKEKNPDLRLTIDQQGLGIDNPSSQTLAFHTSFDERMRITSSGLVGVNTPTPSTLLDLDASDYELPVEAQGAAEFSYYTGSSSPDNTPDTDQATVDITRLGGLSGANALDVYAESAQAAKFVSDESLSATVEIQNQQAATALKVESFSGNGPIIDVEIPGPGTFSSNFIIMRKSDGNQVRIDRNGRGYFNGGTQTGGADIAEWFAVDGERQSYEPGDVLVISTLSDRTVTHSTEPYSTLVAGVYTTRPGVLLTERHIDADHSDMVPMGVIGVVPTKVTGENGPIRRGDLLVSSSIPGHAMRGTDRSRMLGAIIGKALEAFDGEHSGVIRVMVTPR